MKLQQINIRDPFILNDGGKFYLYGTRAKDFGKYTDGFDVYVSEDLETWSQPQCCFTASEYGLNRCVNWAPEIHKYRDSYYMFATFTAETGRRGTYVLKADIPMGPFVPHSQGPVTPADWESLDGTLYLDEAGCPYLVFCHEHTQIIDGTIEYLRLREDLTAAESAPVTLFHGSSMPLVAPKPAGEHYITDGPFLYRSKTGQLLMIWSTFIEGKYAQCITRSDNGRMDGHFLHLDPLITDDGGHGMIFRAGDKLYLTYHSPNTSGLEKPCLRELEDLGDTLTLR